MVKKLLVCLKFELVAADTAKKFVDSIKKFSVKLEEYYIKKEDGKQYIYATIEVDVDVEES